ncbi:MAG: PQQ-binding-like beta-propeller repeat protein [Candidatus Omnitrophota bacterium]
MRKIIFVLLILFLCSRQGFCADWPMFRKDSVHSGQSTELLQPPLSLKWKFEIKEKIISSPCVYQGKLFIGARDNNLYALDAKTGSLLWKYSSDGWIDSSPAAAGDKVYFCSRDGYLYCLNIASGDLVWKYKTGGNDLSSPLVEGQRLFCATGFPNKYIYCINSQTGAELWKFSTEQMVYSSAAVLENNIYIGANDGNLYCLNKKNGTEIWKYKTKGGIYCASPVISDEKVIIAAGDFDWDVQALNISSGRNIWTYKIEDNQPTPNYVSTTALAQGLVFITAGYQNQQLYCLNANKGTLKWKADLDPALRFGFSSSCVVTEDTVYAASGKGILRAFEISTGKLKWQYGLSSGVLSSPCVAHGILYVADLNGTLYALE